MHFPRPGSQMQSSTSSSSSRSSSRRPLHLPLALRLALPLLVAHSVFPPPTLGGGGGGALFAHGATPATRIIANGVPVEIVFVTDESELPTNPDLDTDDFNRPIPAMKGASCSSLDGPNCLAMLYGSTDLLDDALRFDYTSEELMQLMKDHLADLGLDGLDLDFDFGGDLDDFEDFPSNEEILGADVLEFFSGFSKVYSRRLGRGKASPIPEEEATDMATYAEEFGMREDFVPQFDFFWSNLESDDTEYQVYVLDTGELSGTVVAEQLDAYLDGSIQGTDLSFELFAFVIDFDGVKPLELDSYPPHVRELYVEPEQFLEDLAEFFRTNPPSDDDYADFEVGDLSDGFEISIEDELLTLLEDEDATATSSKANAIGSGSDRRRRRRRKDGANNSEEQDVDGSRSRTNADSAASSSSSPSSPSISNSYEESTQGEGRPMKPKEL